jgi:hypothetical protein
VLGTALAYPFVIEPRWLEVTEHHIEGDIAAPLRIALVSDLHTTGFGFIESSVVDAIADAKPDLILLAGDLVHQSGGREPVERFLGALPDAPLGIWLAPGNWEYWRLGRSTKEFYDPGKGRWLVNTSTAVRADVTLVGLDDDLAGKPDPTAALAGVERPFAIALLHSPSGVAPLLGRVDLVLGGHTHGGQARIPFDGPIILPPGDGGYDRGWYEKKGTRVFITRGVGMSVLPARFWCRPEVALIDVTPR